MLIHEKEILITEEFIDQNNHVNNVQFVHWVEMMAAEHWDLWKHKSQYAENVWFLVDHHIQYKQQVYLGENLLVRTYPENPEGIRQPRKVEFYKDGKLVVDSRTQWIMIHPENEKIVRIESDWLESLK
ncbi:acyl-CoA thioesterase [Moheibacter lacus]|uniref:Acyl-CoA thioesterase n=1 Tax=Moheibacter lacus TaxID=2745851 RepID=A0A838ZHZ2_9FLAO|nr:thioesterase family protein [Moheibacter lacus]MBA5628868.1 acyl-CoA thioesterase [Moheibacter lacus]